MKIFSVNTLDVISDEEELFDPDAPRIEDIIRKIVKVRDQLMGIAKTSWDPNMFEIVEVEI